MSLLDEFQDGVEEIFTEFADIGIDFTIKRFVSETVNAGGTLTTITDDSDHIFIRDFFSFLERSSGNVLGDDIKMLVQAKGFGAAPNANDKIVIDGINYDIINSDIDPTDSLYTIQARA